MDNRANLSGKRVVVLGDRQILAEAIKLTLSLSSTVLYEVKLTTTDSVFCRIYTKCRKVVNLTANQVEGDLHEMAQIRHDFDDVEMSPISIRVRNLKIFGLFEMSMIGASSTAVRRVPTFCTLQIN